MRKNQLKILTLLLAFFITFTTLAPSITYAKEVNKNDDISMQVINEFNLTEDEIADVNIISKYMEVDSVNGTVTFNIEKAKQNGVSNELLLEGEKFNSEVKEFQYENSNEPSLYKGRTYLRKMGTNWYQVGISGFWCKKIVGWVGNGAKWVASALIASIPVIGPVASVVANALVSIGQTVLKRYVNTGIVIELKKYRYTSGWMVNYWRQ